MEILASLFIDNPKLVKIKQIQKVVLFVSIIERKKIV